MMRHKHSEYMTGFINLTGFGNANDIARLQTNRYCLTLDGRRFLVPNLVNDIENDFGDLGFLP